MGEKTKSLFASLYNATEETVKALKQPLVEKKIKRKLQSAFDDAEDKKITAQERLEKARKQFEDYDINEILKQKEVVSVCEKLQDGIRNEYSEYFGEEMP